MISIRPHHLLCINFFIGKGYSLDFINNMKEIIGLLNDDPLVLLTSSTDDICTLCPNRVNDKCNTNEKVLSIDNKVLKLINLKSGVIKPYKDLDNLVKTNIINKGLISEVCKTCEWIDICKKIEEKH